MARSPDAVPSVSDLVAHVGDLYALPPAVAHFNRVMNDPKATAQNVADTISTDVVLAAKVMLQASHVGGEELLMTVLIPPVVGALFGFFVGLFSTFFVRWAPRSCDSTWKSYRVLLILLPVPIPMPDYPMHLVNMMNHRKPWLRKFMNGHKVVFLIL